MPAATPEAKFFSASVACSRRSARLISFRTDLAARSFSISCWVFPYRPTLLAIRMPRLFRASEPSNSSRLRFRIRSSAAASRATV